MRPGHINVFDGLRITTEHMNYLQGSFHSAVQDIREILGLGTVYSGFDVVAEGNSITISPGLAFDYQKNRIACDEPKTVEVSFAPGENTKYVCIKYDQIEDGQVEGRFTLVWDSCAIDLQPSLPQVIENVIAIAKIESVARNGNRLLQVTRLGTRKNGDAQSKDLVTQLPPAVEEPTSEIPPVGEGEPGSDTSSAGVAVEESATHSTSPATNGALTTPASTVVETATAENSPETLPATVPGPTITTEVRQGVTRLAPANGAEKLAGTALIESLIRRAAEPVFDGAELSVPLAEAEVALAFPLLSLSCRTIVSGSLSLDASAGGSETVASNFSTTAHGEVTPGSGGVSQFGISTTQVVSSSASQGTPYCFSELTQNGVAHMPLRILGQVSKNGSAAGVLDFLQRLELLIEVPKADTSGFKIICSLRWRGAVTTEEIKEIENKGYVFEWEALVAWKALGESRGLKRTK